ncbi:hypothetical protein GN244_ATG04947 [Phytophthora infestans]|uniref:Uncharacterized protein n=1 Tax=Phytophthora infestans TaxID=4787 RepID=A0A833TL42_PHYIN|nr:hypothetical protein GN244_ATG04947 [Phytophthora infestans]KAF4143215.1 hypothetical protein GN958_ATG07576 [Phytophthora infestans]
MTSCHVDAARNTSLRLTYEVYQSYNQGVHVVARNGAAASFSNATTEDPPRPPPRPDSRLRRKL